MRLLIVRAQGGLCNRMRALLSGVSYAAVTERRFAYAWVRGPDFEPRLDDLWVNPFREVPSRAVSVLARVVGGYTAHADIHGDLRGRIVVTNSNEIIAGADPGVVPWIDRLRALPLHPDLRERVRGAEATWPTDRPVVGVMIRSRRAHDETVAASPLAWFTERMTAIRAISPDVAFFLSSDDPATSAAVRERFGEVLELTGKSAYNSTGGVQDAVCDLYLLASTNYLLGSHYSSFSHTAAGLADHGGYETSRLEPEADVTACLNRSRSLVLPSAAAG